MKLLKLRLNFDNSMASFTHALSEHISDFVMLYGPKPAKRTIKSMLNIERGPTCTVGWQIRKLPSISNIDGIDEIAFMEYGSVLKRRDAC